MGRGGDGEMGGWGDREIVLKSQLPITHYPLPITNYQLPIPNPLFPIFNSLLMVHLILY
ncbi:hypothetical protein NIES267_03730 [Calothrix parasitica NIES-267]|uniref:Uncharacterized protein n=1 Tax=Calothrix parasitica NIES-267 TaxID=1973488 RepID=A0A1Z4LII9_9CYAN|nr:hypothetical protein NIES267_03730 [Calothrix parasitica NIES-267]